MILCYHCLFQFAQNYINKFIPSIPYPYYLLDYADSLFLTKSYGLNTNINNDKTANNLLCMFSLLIECDLLLAIISCLKQKYAKKYS